MARLKRSLGLAECVFFGVGSILGAGIYTLLGKVAGISGNFIWLSFLIASLSALCTAFSYAELSAAFPKSGGEYVYARNAFGKSAGFFLGAMLCFNGVFSGATVAIGFGGYLAGLLGIPVLVAASGIITLMFIINSIGIKQSSWLNIVLTSIEVGGLIFVIYSSVSAIGDVNLLAMPAGRYSSILAAAALAFFAYIGFEDVVKLAEETRQPEKNIPRALFISSAIVFLLYSFVSICAVSQIPYAELGKSNRPMADIIGKSFGSSGIVIISIVALFSTANTILSNMLGSSRVLLTMSLETKVLKKLSFVSSKRNTPIAALFLILILMWSFTLIGNIETIARVASFFIFITFLIVNLSVIVLRFKDGEMLRPYRVPINIKNVPVISVCGIFMTLLLLGYTIYSLFFSLN